MRIKNFRMRIISRVLFIVLTVFLLFYSFYELSIIPLGIVLGIILIYLIYSLIKDAESVVKIMTTFFDSIRYSDFTQSYSAKGLGKAFDELNNSYNAVMNEFVKTRKEKEESLRYMQTIIQHIRVGLITFDLSGEVYLLNNSLKRILKLNSLKHISELSSKSKTLTEILLTIKPGENSLVKLIDNSELLQLSISSTEFKLSGKHYKLVSIANIQNELEEKEMEAWQNLIRVLTHEIMNSITPISSLSSTVNDIISQNELNQENFEDIKAAMQTIQKRSDGLTHFVNNYRSLTKIPAPKFAILPVSKLFQQVIQLMKQQINSQGIKIKCSIDPESLELTCDPQLVEQVLINLILNAIDGLKNIPSPEIELSSRLNERGRILINVKDNGAGILDEVQEKIFIPFFTTKQGGSGIGLSLSRQIMRMHGGSISVISKENQGALFTLVF